MGRKANREYEQTSGLSPWERKVYDDLRDVAEVERTQPAGVKSWTPHLAMAGSLALCLALAVFVAVLVIALRRDLSLETALNDALFGAGLTFAIALSIAILVAVADFRGSLASVERILGRDLDGNGVVGKATRLEVTIHSEKSKQIKMLDLPLTDHVLFTFARAAVNGLPISEREWTGEGKLTPDQYRAFRDALIKRGLARWKHPLNHRAGWELTENGLAVMRELAGK